MADTDGTFDFDVPGSPTELRATHRTHVPRTFDLAACARAPEGGLELTLEPARLTPVRFFDEQGELLPGEAKGTDGRRKPLPLRAAFTRSPLAIGDAFRDSRASAESIVYVRREEALSGSGIEFPEGAAGMFAEREPLAGFAVAVLGTKCVAASVPYVAGSDISFTITESAKRSVLGTLRFKVVDEQSRMPVAGASYFTSVSRSGTVGTDGLAEVTDLPAQALYLEVRALGYGWHNQRVDLTDQPAVDLGEVSLQRAREIRGRVLDDQGQPASGLLVGFAELEAFEDPLPKNRGNVRTDGDGQFRFASARAVQYVVSIRSGYEGWAPEVRVVDLREKRAESVELQLRPSRWCRIELAQPVEPLLRWIVRTTDGRLLTSGWLDSGTGFSTQLGSGPYRLELFDGPRLAGESRIQVAASTESKELVLTPSIDWK